MILAFDLVLGGFESKLLGFMKVHMTAFERF